MAYWWNDFFDEIFAGLLLERSGTDKLAREAAFLMAELQLDESRTVFDQCCGPGDLSLELAKNGVSTIGVDQSRPYIERAQKRAASENLSCRFYQGDALRFLPDRLCDAAFNWYTSFGYSDDDTVNLQMLQRVYESLRPGGRFVLDYTNPAYIFAHFADSSILKTRVRQQDLIVLKESKTDLERGMLISDWTYMFPDGTRQTKTGESRIYLARDLKQMLQSCGFTVAGIKSDINGAPLSKDGARCIITARK